VAFALICAVPHLPHLIAMKVWGVKAARAVPPLIGGAFKSKDRGTFWNRRSSAGVVVQINNYTVTKDILLCD
jgi:hypothetical protein